jgi:hypothetical protein
MSRNNIPKGYTVKRLYDDKGKPHDVLVPNREKVTKKSLVFRGIGMGFKAFLYGILVIPPFFAAMGFVAIGLSANLPTLTGIGMIIIIAEMGFIIFRKRIVRFISNKVRSVFRRRREGVTE